MHEAFINEDGSSKIEVIWDQTYVNENSSIEEVDNISGSSQLNEEIRSLNRERNIESLAVYGRVYTQAQINAALEAKQSGANPLEIVPEQDEEGHGTFLAGIAAGKENRQRGFIGAAPGANLVVVKLKQAKRYLRDFYLVNNNAICYSETDILMGVRFLNEYAELVKKPIAIIIGVGTNIASHAGSTVLSDYIENVARNIGRSVVVAAGNYANSRLHFKGELKEENFLPAEINVGENENGFVCTLWSEPPDIYEIEFVSPTGQIEERIPVRTDYETSLRFVLEGTEIQLYYGVNQALSGQNYAIVKFITPAPGIWTLRVYGENILRGEFNMWLSNEEFLWSDTYFLKSEPDETITDPGNTQGAITVASYDYRDGSIYLGSGRGYTALGRIKPDIAAPGVGVTGPSNTLDTGYVSGTGTSVAAAITAGATALFLEYGVVRGFYPYLRTYTIKNYLISGAIRQMGIQYPNRIWGYGKLNVYSSFENLRGR